MHTLSCCILASYSSHLVSPLGLCPGSPGRTSFKRQIKIVLLTIGKYFC